MRLFAALLFAPLSLAGQLGGIISIQQQRNMPPRIFARWKGNW
jgi:hypothetical protein